MTLLFGQSIAMATPASLGTTSNSITTTNTEDQGAAFGEGQCRWDRNAERGSGRDGAYAKQVFGCV